MPFSFICLKTGRTSLSSRLRCGVVGMCFSIRQTSVFQGSSAARNFLARSPEMVLAAAALQFCEDGLPWDTRARQTSHRWVRSPQHRDRGGECEFRCSRPP
jgi:hypothetical protein